MGTGVEALSTVTSMKQKGLVALNEAELMAQTFDLEERKTSISAEIHVAFLIQTSEGVTIGGRVESFERTLKREMG